MQFSAFFQFAKIAVAAYEFMRKAAHFFRAEWRGRVGYFKNLLPRPDDVIRVTYHDDETHILAQ